MDPSAFSVGGMKTLLPTYYKPAPLRLKPFVKQKRDSIQTRQQQTKNTKDWWQTSSTLVLTGRMVWKERCNRIFQNQHSSSVATPYYKKTTASIHYVCDYLIYNHYWWLTAVLWESSTLILPFRILFETQLPHRLQKMRGSWQLPRDWLPALMESKGRVTSHIP
jgi:hypothetical protein